jgi:hypothetical protein
MFSSQGAQICSSQKTLAFLLEYRQMPLIPDIPLRGSHKLLLEQQVDFLFKLQSAECRHPFLEPIYDCQTFS